MVCKTIRGWFETICALALWCNGSTPDFGSGDIGSNPMNAASHSSNGQDRGFLILQCGFESCMRLTDLHSVEMPSYQSVVLEYHFDRNLVSLVQWQEQVTSNHLIRVRFPYEAYGHVANRLCNRLLICLGQVRLLSCPFCIRCMRNRFISP